MRETLANYISDRQEAFNTEIVIQIEALNIPDRLKQSMLYSIEAGGKRLRPILMMASVEAYGGSYQDVLPIAVALEMVHTYSLIHDDLPAMDDDNYRRGQPTNHKKFDEATAILAGDGLLTYSFELITNQTNITDKQKVFLVNQLAKAGGPRGMVAGQILDMQAEKKNVDLEKLEEIHTAKTGQLIKYAIVSGAFMKNVSKEQMAALNLFAYYLGLIFQVQDDILDVTGDPSLLGKPVGSDESNDKSTYPKLLGLNGAIAQKEFYVEQAKNSLKEAGVKETILEQLTDYLSDRKY
ncbi:polyprenyl synthetase family protein [Aquibacillus saliphilus]|uniref:polyprenyl synthetase family protein n=1 Tax=Aquibacillus saliphilus TaxID=1909422 RepID=UPI001CF0586C